MRHRRLMMAVLGSSRLAWATVRSSGQSSAQCLHPRRPGGRRRHPVWNKSNREHTIIGSEPPSVRAAAAAAVKELGWKLPWFCDADHINLSSVVKSSLPATFHHRRSRLHRQAGRPVVDRQIHEDAPRTSRRIRMEGAGQPSPSRHAA